MKNFQLIARLLRSWVKAYHPASTTRRKLQEDLQPTLFSAKFVELTFEYCEISSCVLVRALGILFSWTIA